MQWYMMKTLTCYHREGMCSCCLHFKLAVFITDVCSFRLQKTLSSRQWTIYQNISLNNDNLFLHFISLSHNMEWLILFITANFHCCQGEGVDGHLYQRKHMAVHTLDNWGPSYVLPLMHVKLHATCFRVVSQKLARRRTRFKLSSLTHPPSGNKPESAVLVIEYGPLWCCVNVFSCLPMTIISLSYWFWQGNQIFDSV